MCYTPKGELGVIENLPRHLLVPVRLLCRKHVDKIKQSVQGQVSAHQLQRSVGWSTALVMEALHTMIHLCAELLSVWHHLQ